MGDRRISGPGGVLSNTPYPQCQCGCPRVCHETNYGKGPCWKCFDCPSYSPELVSVPMTDAELSEPA